MFNFTLFSVINLIPENRLHNHIFNLILGKINYLYLSRFEIKSTNFNC